jgi:hypothetical protein
MSGRRAIMPILHHFSKSDKRQRPEANVPRFQAGADAHGGKSGAIAPSLANIRRANSTICALFAAILYLAGVRGGESSIANPPSRSELGCRNPLTG